MTQRYMWLPICSYLTLPLNGDDAGKIRLRSTARVQVLDLGVERSRVEFSNGPCIEIPTTMLRESEQEAESEDRRILVIG